MLAADQITVMLGETVYLWQQKLSSPLQSIRPKILLQYIH